MRSTQRDDDSAAPNSVLGRALTLLAAFRPDDDDVTLAELRERTGLAKTTTHRLIGELAEWNIVERTPTGVRLGLRLFEMGQRVPAQHGLREAAAPFLSDLFEATHETVHLAVPEGHEVVYVQKIDGLAGPRLLSRVGGRMPLYCTGVGKAVLAFQPPQIIDELIQSGLPRLTPRTRVAPGLLRAELAAIRESGVAYEHEESAVGICCVAAPIFDAQHHAIASISITGWANRINPDRYAPAVRTAAMGIGRTLRGRNSPAPG